MLDLKWKGILKYKQVNLLQNHRRIPLSGNHYQKYTQNRQRYEKSLSLIKAAKIQRKRSYSLNLQKQRLAPLRNKVDLKKSFDQTTNQTVNTSEILRKNQLKTKRRKNSKLDKLKKKINSAQVSHKASKLKSISGKQKKLKGVKLKRKGKRKICLSTRSPYQTNSAQFKETNQEIQQGQLLNNSYYDSILSPIPIKTMVQPYYQYMYSPLKQSQPSQQQYFNKSFMYSNNDRSVPYLSQSSLPRIKNENDYISQKDTSYGIFSENKKFPANQNALYQENKSSSALGFLIAKNL